MTANLISINKDERSPAMAEVHQRIMMRDPENTICEMGAFLTELTSAMNDLGRSYPGIVSICCLTTGQVHSAVVLAPSRDGIHVSPAAGTAVQHLAAVIAGLPADLLATFEATLAAVKAAQNGDGSA
jgi:hypothetical protein